MLIFIWIYNFHLKHLEIILGTKPNSSAECGRKIGSKTTQQCTKQCLWKFRIPFLIRTNRKTGWGLH